MTRRKDLFFYLACFSVLVLPRILRLVYPMVWVEDSYYQYSGNLIRQGLLPFRDFATTQYPGLEFLLALTYALLGPSVRSAEILTQTMALVASLGVLILGIRCWGRKVGLIGAGLMAWHSLFFRYHLAEREIAALIPMSILMILAATQDLSGTSKKAVFFAAAFLGVSLKLTFALSCAAPVLYFLYLGRRRDAITACLLSAAAVLAPTAILLLLFRENFLWQALLYHFAKGANVHTLAERMAVGRLCLDYALALAVPSLTYLALEKPKAGWILPCLWLVPDGLIYTAFSPDLWPHNYIACLPGLCLLGAIWLSEVLTLSYWRCEFAVRRHRVLLLLFVPLFLSVTFPIKNHQWERGSIYGLGFLSRKEIQELAQLIAERSRTEERVLVPEYLAMEAGRRLWNEDRLEAAGVIHRLRENAKATGLLKTFSEMSQEDFWRQAAGSQEPWRSRLLQAIQENSIPVIIPYIDVHLSDDLLRDAGYEKIKTTLWFGVWCLPKDPSSAVQ